MNEGTKKKMTRSEYINYYIRAFLLGGFTFLMVKFGGANPDVALVTFMGATAIDGSVGYVTKTLKDLKEKK